MMEPLVLSRRLELEKYEVVMEIGRQQRREELNAVLMLAEEHGGKATAKQISQELLQGRPETVGKAIIDRCRDLALLDESGGITPIGRDALSTGKVFIPERGRYVIWFTDDPLVLQKLVHIEPKEESHLSDEVAMMKNRNARSEVRDETKTLPEKLAKLKGGPYDLMGKGGGRVVIKSIDQNGVRAQLGPGDAAKITLQIAPAGPHLSAGGGFERVLDAPALDFERSWISALGPMAKLWVRSRDPPALKCGFDELNPKDLTSFSKAVHLSKPSLEGYGEFDDATVDGVPIIPRTSHDAEAWARWLLKKSIVGYIDASQYQGLVKATKSRFPDFPGVELPSEEELAEELGSERASDGTFPRAYWYLRAPMDLRVKEA